jgi:glycosyltransferase involved in cell wall biosynthesis
VKIAHLVISGEVAGGQLVALQLARAARRAGHEVFFVAPEGGTFVERARRDGFSVEIVALRRSFHLRQAWKLRKILRREGADILHTHTLVGAGAPARVTARSAGVRVITHAHTTERYRRQPIARTLMLVLDNATVRLSKHVIAVSAETAAGLIRQGYPESLVTTVPNGVEIPVSNPRPPLPRDLRLEGDPAVLCVGRLCELKGQRDLLDAIARLRESHPRLRAVFAGTDPEGGAYEAFLRRRADQLGLSERVIFAGHRDDVPALLAATNMLVLPSHHEGMPMIILEAMANGRPVVATCVGGIPELIEDRVSGLLVPPGDVESLANAIARVLEDTQFAVDIAANARARATESFSAEPAAERVLALYADALA